MDTAYCVFTLVFALVQCVSADTIIICGDQECHGGSPYCCELNDGTTGCCWDSYVYQMWWFWMIWIVAFFLIFACSLSCWRRRRAQYRYMVMSNSEYPSYGTVVHAAPPTMVYNNPQQGYATAAGSAPPPMMATPTKPPSYEAAEASKPPPYSG